MTDDSRYSMNFVETINPRELFEGLDPESRQENVRKRDLILVRHYSTDSSTAEFLEIAEKIINTDNDLLLVQDFTQKELFLLSRMGILEKGKFVVDRQTFINLNSDIITDSSYGTSRDRSFLQESFAVDKVLKLLMEENIVGKNFTLLTSPLIRARGGGQKILRAVQNGSELKSRMPFDKLITNPVFRETSLGMSVSDLIKAWREHNVDFKNYWYTLPSTKKAFETKIRELLIEYEVILTKSTPVTIAFTHRITMSLLKFLATKNPSYFDNGVNLTEEDMVEIKYIELNKFPYSSIFRISQDLDSEQFAFQTVTDHLPDDMLGGTGALDKQKLLKK